LGKYLAYLVCTLLLTLPAVVIIYFLLAPIGGAIGQGFPSLATDLGMLVLGIASYGAVFALVGARVSRPLVTGLVFAFGWEPAILFVPGYLKHATVAYYLQALVPHSMPQGSGITALLEVFQQTPSVWASLAALAAITGTSLWFAGRAVEEREYVLEQ
jgi:hypothetical protein